MLLSNVSIYKQILEESYSKMNAFIEEGRTPKKDGTDGYIIKADPNHNSFKQSMIVIVFTGMWLEAMLHQEIVSRFGKNTFKEHDRSSYRNKLTLLGISDTDLLNNVDLFKSTRKELVHEKAFFDRDGIKVTQREAERAHKIMECILHALDC